MSVFFSPDALVEQYSTGRASSSSVETDENNTGRNNNPAGNLCLLVTHRNKAA
jgi:hypothetical protein